MVKLFGFIETKKLIDKLVSLRKSKKRDKLAEARLIDMIGDEMKSSQWFEQVKGRGERVVAKFTSNGLIEQSKRE